MCAPAQNPTPFVVRGRVVEAVALALIATAMFTPVFAMGKILDGAAPAFMLILLRYCGGTAVLVLAVIATRTPLAALRSSGRAHLHFCRALCAVGGLWCALEGARLMPVATATAIGMTDGMLIVVLSAALLGESVSVRRWFAAGLCAIGAVVALGPALWGDGAPGHAEGAALIGAAYAFGGAVLIAIETVLIKILVEAENGLGVLLYVNGFGMLIATMIAVGVYGAAAWPAGLDPEAWAAIAVMGPTATGAQYLNVLAYRRADASVLGPVNYAWVVFAALLGFVAFGETPGPMLWLGAGLIIIGGVLLTRDGDAQAS